MAKVVITLGFILAVALVGASASSMRGLENARVTFVSSEEMKEILKKYPNHVELSSKIHKQEFQPAEDTKESAIPAPRLTIEYFLGARTPYDWLVAHDAQSHTWNSPRDIQMNIRYPATGTGYIVTYVNILVSQSSAVGRAYVVEGGIGFRYIGIVVEADNTYYFDHNANVYAQN